MKGQANSPPPEDPPAAPGGDAGPHTPTPEGKAPGGRTRAELFNPLDQVEPGVGHLSLSGEALRAKLKQEHIGPLKNKQYLINAQQKAAGEQLAEKAEQQEALEAVEKERVKVR